MQEPEVSSLGKADVRFLLLRTHCIVILECIACFMHDLGYTPFL
jgi:dGTP triphosphohydrolase